MSLAIQTPRKTHIGGQRQGFKMTNGNLGPNIRDFQSVTEPLLQQKLALILPVSADRQ